MSLEPAQDPIADIHNPNHYKVGTLSYTKAGLVTLFVYLLWGDFCWCLMESVIPSVLPQKLNALHASDTLLIMIMTTIPSAMTTVLNPIVSFQSDRYRSKWGRRMPFLGAVTPFLVLFLILLGFEAPISEWIHRVVLGGRYSDTTVALWVIGILMVLFQFFNLFTQAVFYYLFNDVVPRAFLARFVALFRIAGGLAGMFYSKYIFAHAYENMQLVFLGAGMLFLFGYGLMCWKVREGEYPPPPPNVDNEDGVVGTVKTYALECYSHRFYWFIFLSSSFQALTWVSGSFSLLLSLNYMGFNRQFLGDLGFYTGLIGLLMNYPAGMIADRFHPIRIMVVAVGIQLLISPFNQIFIFSWRPHMNLLQAEHWQIFFSMIGLPMGIVAGACEMPLFMKLFPQERYGQFCSANALIRGLSMTIGSLLCGEFIDGTRGLNSNPDYAYRFVGIWNLVAVCGYYFFLVMIFREWKKLGGLSGYTPPKAEPSKRLVATVDWILAKVFFIRAKV